MDLLPSEEQLEIIGAAEDFIASRLPTNDIRRRHDEDSSIDADVWREGAELGLLTLGLDEAHGGSGRQLDDEVLLFAALARNLATGPFLASTLAARVAARCGDTDLTMRIGAGRAPVGLAELRGAGVVGPDGFKGDFDLLDCHGTGHALVVTEHGCALVELPEFGEISAVKSLDPGTRLATASVVAGDVLHWVPAETESIWDRAMLLATAGLAGLAEATLATSTEYAKARIQFDRPIGVNQAIKHACADMAVRADAAMSQTLFAAVSLQSGRPDARFQLLAAKSVAARAAIANAEANIHIHGGMGYTYEHDAHLYLKRAHVLNQLFGELNTVLADLLAQEPAQ